MIEAILQFLFEATLETLRCFGCWRVYTCILAGLGIGILVACKIGFGSTSTAIAGAITAASAVVGIVWERSSR